MLTHTAERGKGASGAPARYHPPIASAHMKPLDPPSSAQDPGFAPMPGEGGLPRVLLVAADGARAEIYLHGAHLTSWIPAGEAGDGADRLFVSARSRFAPGVAIRGGIPVCFPQFADQGPLPAHGFARITPWALVDAHRTPAGAARGVFRLGDTNATRGLWPHRFAVELTVTVAGRQLEVGFAVTNTGASTFAFTGALHTYLRMTDVGTASVHGLQHARYRDKALGVDDVLEAESALRIDREIDRAYYAAPADLEARAPDRTTAARATGFPDTVVWNPGAVRGATLEDLEPDGHLRMLCVEAAIARSPVELAPGVRWQGTQVLTAR
jgi:glucose-6-phosphate 1-epimerase